MATERERRFTFAEFEAVTRLGRGEIRECIKRGIISQPAGVGQGNHRTYTPGNILEGLIAATLLRQVRAGYVERMMPGMRLQMDVEQYAFSAEPKLFLVGHLQPRVLPHEIPADAPVGEEFTASSSVSTTDDLIAHLTSRSEDGIFANIVVDLQKVVDLANAAINTLLAGI